MLLKRSRGNLKEGEVGMVIRKLIELICYVILKFMKGLKRWGKGKLVPRYKVLPN